MGHCQFKASASHDITSGSVGMRPPQTSLLLITRPGVYIKPYLGYSARLVTFSKWASTPRFIAACRASASTFLQLSQPGPNTLMSTMLFSPFHRDEFSRRV